MTPSIQSSTYLRNNDNKISAFCHESREPVFITKNGQGDMVVMSIKTFEQINAKLELYALLDAGREAVEKGQTRPLANVMKEIKQEIVENSLLL